METTGIRTIGALPGGLPPLSMPDFSMSTIKQLAPVTLAATLFALTEAVSIARSLGARTHQHRISPVAEAAASATGCASGSQETCR